MVAFQSLIGILFDCNSIIASRDRSAVVCLAFQSLIGILFDCNRWFLKPLLYLVFKVRLGESIIKVPFQPPACQEAKFSTTLKTFHSKHYSVCGNRFFLKQDSNLCYASDTATKNQPLKKTPTDSPKSQPSTRFKFQS
jgi:hypothetical protein